MRTFENRSVKHRKMPESIVALRKMVFSILHISMVYTEVNSSEEGTPPLGCLLQFWWSHSRTGPGELAKIPAASRRG